MMENNETKNLDYLKKLTALHFRTLKPVNDNSKEYIAQIKVVSYFELGCVITDMLKLCILALNHDGNVGNDKSKAVDVALILETALSIFPLNEMEFLSDVSYILDEKS